MITALVAAIATLAIANSPYFRKEIRVTAPQAKCVCPEPKVTVQPFDVDKIKNLKTFSYSPQFQGTISMSGVDSIRLSQIVSAAVEKSVRETLQKNLKDRFLKTSWFTLEDLTDSVQLRLTSTQTDLR